MSWWRKCYRCEADALRANATVYDALGVARAVHRLKERLERVRYGAVSKARADAGTRIPRHRGPVGQVLCINCVTRQPRINCRLRAYR